MAFMALQSKPVAVRVPATSANLGPGFDTLGLALCRFDEVRARVVAEGVTVRVTGEGAGELPADSRHLVVRTMQKVFEALGETPSGLLLECHNRIPQARGLGSSSAAIVAGILLARALVEGGVERFDDAASSRRPHTRMGGPFRSRGGSPRARSPCAFLFIRTG
jgi:homoserine kinase